MPTINLQPLLASIAGSERATRATFTGQAMTAGNPSVRVIGGTAVFAEPYVARWDGNQWDRPPILDVLPVGEYWDVHVVVPPGMDLHRTVIVPSDGDVDFGDLLTVTPDTGTVDTSTLSQVLAERQYVTNLLEQVRAVAAEIRDMQATTRAEQAQAALDGNG